MAIYCGEPSQAIVRYAGADCTARAEGSSVRGSGPASLCEQSTNIVRLLTRSLPTDIRVPAILAHGLAGVVLQAASDLLSKADEATLDNHHRRAAAWAGMLGMEATRLLAAMPRDVQPIVLKGPAIARHYGVPQARTFGDIDLLIPATALNGCEAALNKIGYSSYDFWARRNARRGFDHEVALLRERPRMRCELHWCVRVQRGQPLLSYEDLHPLRGPGGTTEASTLSASAQTIVTAVEHVMTPTTERRAVKLIDLLELNTRAPRRAVDSAAQQLGVSAHVEQAFEEVERFSEDPQPYLTPPIGRPSLVTHLGRDLRFIEGMPPKKALVYLLTRVDPRRVRLWRD